MIVLKPEADRDLAEASGWYEGKQIGLGVDFLVEVDRTFARIERRPAGYRKIRGDCAVSSCSVTRIVCSI